MLGKTNQTSLYHRLVVLSPQARLVKVKENPEELAHASSEAVPFPEMLALNPARLAAVFAETSFEELYRRTFPRVYAFLRAHVRSREAAEDLVSHVFEKALTHRDRAPSGQAAVHWIFRIAKNTLIDHWRVEGRRSRSHVDIEELGAFPGKGATPEEAFATMERQQMLLAVTGDLEESDRLILSLKFAGQRTNRDIAAILDLKEGAISMRLLRALRRLRQRLQDMGIR